MKFHFIPPKKFDDVLLELRGFSGAKAKKSCRSREMLHNAPTLAIVASGPYSREQASQSFHFQGVFSFHSSNPIFIHYSVRFSSKLMIESRCNDFGLLARCNVRKSNPM